jgi:hypothetical protein
MIGPRNMEKHGGEFFIRLRLACFFNNLWSVYRYFEGHVPTLVTSDLEIIQEVFVKQFNNFSSRKVIF